MWRTSSWVTRQEEVSGVSVGRMQKRYIIKSEISESERILSRWQTTIDGQIQRNIRLKFRR